METTDNVKTELLLSSSAAGGLDIRKAFEMGSQLDVSGIEIMPYKSSLFTLEGNVGNISELADRYKLPVRGVHFPFWWETKSTFRAIWNEFPNIKEMAMALAWAYLVGPGSKDSLASQLATNFRDAYLLFHGDTFCQMPEEDMKYFTGRKVLFETERPKRNSRNDLQWIVETVIPIAHKSGVDGKIMFDPRHIQIAQMQGKADNILLEQIWMKYQGQMGGMHFSFIRDGNYFPSSPSPEVWSHLKEAVKAYPPKILVLEVGPGKQRELEKCRDLVYRDLGI